MARGHPDFGATAPRELTTPQLDSGELAARLGSPDLFDRLGTVIGLYVADGMARSQGGLEAAGARRDSFVTNSPFGPYVYRLTVEADGEEATISHTTPYIGDAPVGVEAIFRQRQLTDHDIELRLLVDNGTASTIGALRWDGGEQDWHFRNSAAAYVDTPTQPAGMVANVWRTLKLVVNPMTQQYGRTLVNGEGFGLAGTAGDDAFSVSRDILTSFRLRGGAAATVNLDLAAVIVTVNEL